MHLLGTDRVLASFCDLLFCQGVCHHDQYRGTVAVAESLQGSEGPWTLLVRAFHCWPPDCESAGGAAASGARAGVGGIHWGAERLLGN